jgi:hypothetical protein
MARDLYVPISAVRETRGNQVFLNVLAARIKDMGWLTTADEHSPGRPR